jgi:predicted DNA-binding transcriptional regulator AlpA
MPANTIPISTRPPEAEVTTGRAPAEQALAQPLLVGAREAAALCSLSLASWYRLKAGGKLPLPVRLSGRVLWRRAELEAWTAAGCPPQRTWEAMKAR